MGWWKADPEPKVDPPPYISSSQAAQPSNPQSSSSECPVDHKTRSVWLEQAQNRKTPIAPHPLPPNSDVSECPVDPKTREVWLQKARAHAQAGRSPQDLSSSAREDMLQQIQNQQNTAKSSPQTKKVTSAILSGETSENCSSDRISQSPSTEQPASKVKTSRPLSHDREVSSIPRAQPDSLSKSAVPSNNESETGHDKASGNWIYPSESQFFNAVMRKQTTDPHTLAQSISSIIPIHNAVNERAWHLIKTWEGDSSKSCGGPKLLSFQGLGAGAISPRAKMKTWMGYTEPFDRHDWVVERCGGDKVEYIIDFYQGKAPEGGNPREAANINFYLDVRPKLNSFEGCKMRLERFMGWR